MKKILSLIIVLFMAVGMLAEASVNEPERNLYINYTQIGEGVIVKLTTTEGVELLIPLEESLDALGLNVRKEDECIYFDYCGEKFICQFENEFDYAYVSLTTIDKKDSKYSAEYVELGTWTERGVCYYINDRIYLSKITAEALFFFLGCEITFDEETQSVRINKLAEPEISIKRYLDVSSRDWFRFSVQYVSDNKYMEGTSELYFSPNIPTNRATVASVLYNVAGKPTDFIYHPWFDDVKYDAPYVYSLMWAQRYGIVNGVGNNKFNPEGSVTRQDFAVMLLRYIKHCGFELPQIDTTKIFVDEAEISDYAKEAVQTLNFINVLKGRDDGTIDPQGNVTRAEVAVMIQRMMNYFTNDTGDVNYL